MTKIETGFSADAYKKQILDVFVERFEASHASLPDAYALIWAIDVYATIAANELGLDDIKFKNQIEPECEEFEIIRSASNAIKHVARKDPQRVVVRIDDVRLGGGGPHAWFFNGGSSARSVCIDMSWEYDRKNDSFVDRLGRTLERRPSKPLKSQYLRQLYKPAIKAIFDRLSTSEREAETEE